MKAVERWTKDFPVLYFDTTIGDEAGDYIVSNNLYGGYNMTNYLLDRGHKKIGFVGTRLMIPSIDDRFLDILKLLWKEVLSTARTGLSMTETMCMENGL